MLCLFRELSILPKLTYRFNAIQNKIPARFFFFVDIDKFLLKFIQKGKGPGIDETILKKKNTVKGFFFKISRFVLCYSNKIVALEEDRHIDQ